MQIFEQKIKLLVVTCVFECFQSHCHILKELYEFLCMMSAIIIFEESLKDECEYFYNKIQMNHLT